jgi:hypothetical protein
MAAIWLEINLFSTSISSDNSGDISHFIMQLKIKSGRIIFTIISGLCSSRAFYSADGGRYVGPPPLPATPPPPC